MKKYGFTLIELLAVIVVLAIILAIAIPSISEIITSSTKGAFESDAKMVLQQLEYEKLNNRNFDVTTVDENTITNYGLSNGNYMDLVVGILEDQPYIIITGQNKWKDLKACGTIRNMAIVNINDTTTCQDISTVSSDYNTLKGVNKPKLAPGMTAIKWNGTIEQTVSNPDTDTSWYDYANKQWANAKTADGSYWVWIPRYAYQIESGYHTAIVGKINIKFLMNDTSTTQDSTVIETIPTYNSERTVQTNFVLHPAFKFGVTELTGIWVAKFEPTAAEGVDNGYIADFTCPNGGDNVNSKTIKVIPNAQSWRCITIGNAFAASRNMETKNVYGWGTTGIDIDTHVMKNTEWGAVAYLSQSTYGKNSKVWINNSSTYTTGCAGNSESEPQYSGCQNAYDTANGMQSSTTGNIYGVYDMYGSAWETTIGNFENNQASESLDPATVDDKYINRYGGSNRGYNDTAFGDAVYETSLGATWNGTAWEGNTGGSWDSGSSYMPLATNPWFLRGGRVAINSIFTFSYGNNTIASSRTFRPVLLVGTGL